jgi:diguanylate cyclase (GGDEF)-like protein
MPKYAATAICLILIEVDWFKAVNDAAGDAALREIAIILRAECRVGDLIVRTTGDEVIVLLTRAAHRPHPAGPAVADRIRTTVDTHDWTAVLGTTQPTPHDQHRRHRQLRHLRTPLTRIRLRIQPSGRAE